MPNVSNLHSPEQLVALSDAELDELGSQIRQFLIEKVSASGGHLGPNLGVVELTIAIHRVFHSPNDPILFDTGHISYVHKILTGRQSQFDTLRKAGGLSGYPSRQESEHDWLENSHASSALSWGTGMAEAFQLKGDLNTVVVVVGDGALTGGMAWEALNNIAVHKDLRMVIVVNDNGRSYTPTVGGLAHHLSAIRTDHRYDPTMDVVKTVVQKTPLVGRPAYELLHALKVGLKDMLAPQGLFSDLDLKYIGPVDGHDRVAVEMALTQAKQYNGPVMVHCITKKGHGFKAAELNEEDHHHAVDAVSSSKEHVPGRTWTSAFGDEIFALAQKNPEIVAISAAMVNPVGLRKFSEAFPSRVFDVGIAEQHAVASAAGMAMAGLKPVFAVYASFMNRGFDQLLMDVGLHSMPVTIVLDRAGVTGPDGASHHGVWDLSILGGIPGMRVAAPRDEVTLRRTLTQAINDRDHPTALRFPKGEIPTGMTEVRQESGMDILLDHEDPQVTVIAVGPMTGIALEAARKLTASQVSVRVIDPVWVLPVNPALISVASTSSVVVTLEDGIDDGGVGQKIEIALADLGHRGTVVRCAIPTSFIPQGSRSAILAELGFTAQVIADRVLGLLHSD